MPSSITKILLIPTAILALVVSSAPAPVQSGVLKCYPGQLCDPIAPLARRLAEADAEPGSKKPTWPPLVSSKSKREAEAEPGSKKPTWPPLESSKVKREADSRKATFDEPFVPTRREHEPAVPPMEAGYGKREAGSRKGAFEEPWVSTKVKAREAEPGSRKGTFEEPWVST